MEPDIQWIDCETAAKAMRVCGFTVRRWCRSGHISHWRTRGFGAALRYQISRAALDDLRARYVAEHRAANPPRGDASAATRESVGAAG